MCHVFVIQGDIAHQACDAWMLPTSAQLDVSRWDQFVPGPPDRVARSKTADMRSQRPMTAVLDGASDRESQIVFAAVPLFGFRSAEELAPAVTEFSDMAAAAIPPAPRDGRSRPLITMPFFGTHGGVGADRRGEILDVLLATMRESARRNDSTAFWFFASGRLRARETEPLCGQDVLRGARRRNSPQSACPRPGRRP